MQRQILIYFYVTTGVAVLSMNKPPVNSLNLEFLTELNIALEKVENDKNCKGLIITSVGIVKLLLSTSEGSVKLHK